LRHLLRSLRARLVLSHLVVVAVGVAVLVVTGRQLGSVFVHDHLQSMGGMMGGTEGGLMTDVEAGVKSGFTRALLWATAVSAAVAVTAASFASVRVLRPLEEVRRVTRRLATGSYRERVPIPEERELEALAADVNALAQALEETEKRRLRLVSEVAHEMRTPVATLKGYMEGLLDGVFQPTAETFAAAAGEAARLERLAADLSALSRAEEGRVELRLEETDLGEVAAEVADRLRPQYDDQQVELVVEPGPPLPVLADRDRIAQVFTNLIGNALTYTPSGGEVVVRPEKVADQARVAVIDTGRGLTADQLEMVFERFYRADRSVAGGTGIGLTIARSLARLHGGDLSASSPGTGRGATFTLTLPPVGEGSE
jgi:histidine kinase